MYKLSPLFIINTLKMDICLSNFGLNKIFWFSSKYMLKNGIHIFWKMYVEYLNNHNFSKSAQI